MTRNEMLRFISERPELANEINEEEGKNFTRVKTYILASYIEDYAHCPGTTNNANDKIDKKLIEADMLKSAVFAFLVILEQKGLLDDLLLEINKD